MSTEARVAVSAALTQAVNESGVRVADIANALGVRRQTVYQWLGGDIPLDRLGPLADLLGRSIVIRIGPDDRASWPEWARTIDEKLDALVRKEVDRDELLREAAETVAQQGPDAAARRVP